MAATQALMSQEFNNPYKGSSCNNKLANSELLPPYRKTFASGADINLCTLLSQNSQYNRIESSHLCHAWQYSTDIINQATRLLEQQPGLHPSIHSVVLAGSFGRMEGGKYSDFDFFVIAHDGSIQSKQDEKDLVALVWEQLRVLPVEPPDSHGIFTRVVTPSILCDENALGNLEYARHVFGLRMQLLTDSQPIYGFDALQQLQKDIVRWYCQPDYSPFSHSITQYLLADLKRYFASYAIWHQYRFDKTFNDSWLMRQIKMQHSRLASYTALAISVMNAASTHTGDNNHIDEQAIAAALSDQLKYTPLERLIMHWPADKKEQLLDYLTHYNRIASLIADPELRQIIINENPENVCNRTRGFAGADTPEPILTEIVDTLEHMRQLLTACVTHTMDQSNRSTAACWAL